MGIVKASDRRSVEEASISAIAGDAVRAGQGIARMERIQMEVCRHENAETEEDIRRIHLSVQNIMRHETRSLLQAAEGLRMRMGL
jgi:hypothetical protein